MTAQLFAPVDPVLAASRWPDNGYLIADCARLGYLRKEWLTLDPTYGEGNWWIRWRPDNLVTSDKYKPAEVLTDFMALPFADRSFDAAVYDPPYISPGGRTTTTTNADALYENYGLHSTPKTAAGLQAVINSGLAEVARVVRRRGYVLVKCCDYVDSAKIWWGTHLTRLHGESVGLELCDRFEHVGTGGPQSQKTQRHARRNLSTLLVFQVRRREVQ